jgi:hypothetical protein
MKMILHRPSFELFITVGCWIATIEVHAGVLANKRYVADTVAGVEQMEDGWREKRYGKCRQRLPKGCFARKPVNL